MKERFPSHQQPIYEQLVGHMRELGHSGPGAVSKVNAMLKDHPSFKRNPERPLPLKQSENEQTPQENENLPNPYRKNVKPLY